MPVTTGNFQDLVQLSLDTLYHLGPDLEVGNSSVASTVSIGFQNATGDVQLAAAASAAGTQVVWLPSSGGTLLSNINVSAGTTSNNLSAVTFSNSNGVSFGLNGSTITASVTPSAASAAAIAAGTQTATSGTVVFSNSNNVTFGMSNSSVVTASVTVASTQGSINLSAGTTSNLASAFTFSNSNNVSFGLNASTITARAQVNVSAGTTSNNLSAVTLANSNGLSFGLNASTVTAAYGGFSSWSNGGPATALSNGQNTLHFQPFIIPYALTVTNLAFLMSISNSTTNVSGGFSLSAGLYTLNGGSAGSLSLASSASTNITWTSGAPLSSNTGINYQQMSVASWALTPGPYLFAWWISTQNSASLSYYGPAAQPVIASNLQSAMSALMVNGYSQATTNAMPASFGITNTASYIRTGATAENQPYIIMQGT